MSILTYFLLFITTIFSLVYQYLKTRFQHWEKLKVPYVPANSFIFGNDTQVVFGKISPTENVHRLYKELAPHRYGGAFVFYNPVLYIRDPELIKNVLVKDFDHFSDRSYLLADENEPLTCHLFNLHGEKWKLLRAKLTPVFTSGKMKFMFDLVKECSENLHCLFDEKANNGETVKIKDVMARYTIDVISSCAFGLQSNSIQDQSSNFHTMGVKVFTPTFRTEMRNLLFNFFPRATNFLFRNIPKDITDFFTGLVQDTVEYRKNNNIQYNDFINLIMKLLEEEEKNEGKPESPKKLGLNLHLLTAQCFVFFLAGFETSSTTLSYIIFELANNQEIQSKLQDEVDRVLQQHQGQITYEALQEMSYMDKVIHETLRLHPVTPILFRTCNKDYPIPDSDFILKKGEILFIPVYGLHRDPQYFSNPETFNPENFSEEVKQSRPGHVYLPFGEGPRNCIGIRFSFMQMKMALATILRSGNFNLAPEMKLPLELKPYATIAAPKNEILVKFIRKKDR